MGDPETEYGSYVVHLIGTDDPHEHKWFSSRSDAKIFAHQQVKDDHAERADIYGVNAGHARDCVAMVKAGQGILLESANHRASQLQILEAHSRVHEKGQQALAANDTEEWRRYVHWLKHRKED